MGWLRELEVPSSQGYIVIALPSEKSSMPAVLVSDDTDVLGGALRALADSGSFQALGNG